VPSRDAFLAGLLALSLELEERVLLFGEKQNRQCWYARGVPSRDAFLAGLLALSLELEERILLFGEKQNRQCCLRPTRGGSGRLPRWLVGAESRTGGKDSSLRREAEQGSAVYARRVAARDALLAGLLALSLELEERILLLGEKQNRAVLSTPDA